MKTVRQIYGEYKIMSNLQMHQLRVASVGKLLCENLTKPVHTDDVVRACLFHDMGNILKFKLGFFPKAVEPEGVEYWQKVKDEYAKEYGAGHHEASVQIAKELGLSEAVISYISTVAMEHIPEVLAGDSMERKICEYSDLRVGPYGVISMEDRFLDFKKRYGSRPDITPEKVGRFESLVQAGRELEKQIFASARMNPADITDDAIHGTVESLWNYEV